MSDQRIIDTIAAALNGRPDAFRIGADLRKPAARVLDALRRNRIAVTELPEADADSSDSDWTCGKHQIVVEYSNAEDSFAVELGQNLGPDQVGTDWWHWTGQMTPEETRTLAAALLAAADAAAKTQEEQ